MTLKDRSSGLLLALSSLPSKYGIGDLGPVAHQWIEFLSEHHQKYWQLLPVGIFDKHACPYASYSAFGGHHLFISLDELYNEGLLDKKDLESALIPSTDKLNLSLLIDKKTKALKTAAKNFYASSSTSKSETFLSDFPYWGAPLLDYCDGKFGGNYQEHLFWQYTFHKQWGKLKSKAQQHRVELFGDLPIFVGQESMDTQKFPANFKLNAKGEPLVVTGAPPDDFSPDGQTWNTPNYDWDKMSLKNFDWWIERIKYQQHLYHMIRIDHFIGLVNVWEVHPDSENAKSGKWVKSRGKELLEQIYKSCPGIKLIAEDLGAVTQEVHDLREEFEIPSMRVFQFAFGGDENNIHLPDKVEEQSIYYTGTHDNRTLCQWLEILSPQEKRLMALKDILPTADSALNSVFSSKAQVVISPVQDILRKSESARMNVPGTIENNWIWRMTAQELDSPYWNELSLLTKETQRFS